MFTAPQQPECGIIKDLTAAQIPLHIVVLAAGRGSRLGAVGDATPKWLLPVGGRTIADRHLAGFAEAGDAVASMSVVTGHAAADIEAALAERDEAVRVIHNPEYAEINNWWSVLRALRELPDDGPVVIVNADLLVDPEVVAGFLRAGAGGNADALLAIDFERNLTDESMKVEQDAEGRLTRIGKVGMDAPVGEYIGMLMARGTALHDFRASLESFVGRDECVNEWYEGAVGRTAAEGTAWDLWAVPSGEWVEIDDDADLLAAEAMAGAR